MSKPNLLFILTDQQRADTMAAYGNTQIQTPNLNRLSGESVIFDRAYVSQSVCTPSRSTIMTGLYPHSTGCTENNRHLSLDIPCLPEIIADENYVAGYHGKWHLGDEIFAQHGFDEWISIEDSYARYYRDHQYPKARSSYHRFLTENGFRPREGELFRRDETARLPEEYSKPAFLAQEASRFIRQNSNRPFVLYVSFLEPHPPFFSPRDEQHDPDHVSLPANFNYPPTEEQPLKVRLLYEAYRTHFGDGRTPLEYEPPWRGIIAHYWGLCSLVDTYVGTVLDTLDECGLRDKTIVLYTSDHGDMLGSHRLLAKYVMYEEATRVPLLIRLPGQRSSWHVRGPVSQIDLLPTLLDLMGQGIPGHLQGRSLRPLLQKGGEVAHEGDVFLEWNGPNACFGDILGKVVIPEWMEPLAPREQIEQAFTDPVRTVITADGWKFNCSPLGEHELYNLDEDPSETKNLATDRDHTPLMRDLARRLLSWQEKVEDHVDLRQAIREFV